MGEILKGYLIDHYNALNTADGKNLLTSANNLLEAHETLIKALSEDIESTLQQEDWKKVGKEEFVTLFSTLKQKITDIKGEINNFLIPAANKAVAEGNSLYNILSKLNEQETALETEKNTAAEYQRQLDAIAIPSSTQVRYSYDSKGKRISGSGRETHNPDYDDAMARRGAIQEKLDGANRNINTLLTNMGILKEQADVVIKVIASLDSGIMLDKISIPEFVVNQASIIPTTIDPIIEKIIQPEGATTIGTSVIPLDIKPGDYVLTYTNNGAQKEGKYQRTVQYWLHIPEGATTNMPVTVYLHGSGHSGTEINKITGSVLPKTIKREGLDNSIVLIPQYPTTGIYFADVTKSLVDEVVSSCKADPNKVALAAFSYGGSTAYDLVAKYPERFTSVVIMSSDIRKEALQKLIETDSSLLPKITVLHSTRDTDYNYSEMMNKLEPLGNKIDFRTVENGGHSDTQYKVFLGEEYLKLLYLKSDIENN